MADTAEHTENTTQPAGDPTPPRRGWWWKLGLGLAAAAACLAVAVWGVSSRGTAGASGTSGEEPVLDTVPPRLLGVEDRTVALGGTVSYRDGVTAVDDVDGPVSFQVDAAAVDLSASGTYPVTYTAQDAAGNEVQATITVTVIETITVDQDMEILDGGEDPAADGSGGGTAAALSLENITQEDVDQLADQILARITTPGMSQWEKAKAIYDYVSQHVKYVGTSDKSSWIIGAYVGFVQGRGDCYNYYACSKALLTRAGISNVDLRRVGGTSRHYWQLVNTGGGWYHFDTCPHPNGYPLYSFMLTETQVRAYTKQASAIRQNYYVYDYASCPVQVAGMPQEERPVPAGDASTEDVPDGSQPADGAALPEDGSQPAGGEALPKDGSQPADGEALPEDGSQPAGGEALPGDSSQPTDGEALPGDSSQPTGGEALPGDSSQPADGEALPGDSSQAPPEEPDPSAGPEAPDSSAPAGAEPMPPEPAGADGQTIQ